MQMYEYGFAWGRNGHVYRGIDDTQLHTPVKEYISSLGRDGWEFAGIMPERDGHMLIFKRPAQM